MAVQVWNGKQFLLQTKQTSYVMEADGRGILRHLYWGKRIGSAEDFAGLEEAGENGYHPYEDRTMEEYAVFGCMRYKECACQLSFSDGTGDFRYELESFQAEEEELHLSLKDVHYPCSIHLHYRVYPEENIIRRSAEIRNEGAESIIIERLGSAQFGLPGTDYRSLQFNGGWAMEFRKEEDTVRAGKKVYESLRGSTAHVTNPAFILHREAKEESGEVYFGLLAYSGNHKVTVEATPYEYTNVVIGMSDTDFAWELKAGETVRTPDVYCGYTDGGFGTMSRSLHRLEHRYLMPKEFAGKPLKVLYNSWYATYFDVRCEDQMRLAEKAAAIGTELFVVDDGWFLGRDNDTKALGDWQTDPAKFPNGLQELIRHVKTLGMEFGLWIEPEMVNEDSGLYREHPDWVYRFENRPILKGRNQYVLDLTNEEVVQFLIRTLDELLSENEISYLKWDMNRAMGETGNAGGNLLRRKEIWKRHTDNFYRVAAELRRRHPKVELEACASGGGRADLGAMQYFDEYWPSDNTDPLDRLAIQEHYSLLYPIKYMRAWVTDSPDGWTKRSVPLSFALHAAMCGSLGIGTNLNQADEEELAQIREQVETYKRIREVVQFGELYRLNSFERDDFHAVQYVKDRKSVVFAFLVHGRYGKSQYRMKLRGLDPEKQYRVTGSELELVKSGAFLMHYGVPVKLEGDYDSVMIEVEGKCI